MQMQFLRGAKRPRKTWHGKLTPKLLLLNVYLACLRYCIFAQRKKNGRLTERENRPGVKLFSTPVLPQDVIRRISLYPSCLDKSGAWETPEISISLFNVNLLLCIQSVSFKLYIPFSDRSLWQPCKDYTEWLKVVFGRRGREFTNKLLYQIAYVAWKFKHLDVLPGSVRFGEEVNEKTNVHIEKEKKGGRIREKWNRKGLGEGSSMEGQLDREQKLRLDKKQFESRVRVRFGSETCALLYIAINITQKLGHFEKKKRKEKKRRRKKRSLKLCCARFRLLRFSHESMDNFAHNNKLRNLLRYASTNFFFLFYRRIFLLLSGGRRFLVMHKISRIASGKSESTAENCPSLIDRTTQMFAPNVSVYI